MILEHGGGGFTRPAGDPDLAYIIWQIYDWMRSNTITFYFDGNRITFDYWQVFIAALMFWMVADILYFGFKLFNRE